MFFAEVSCESFYKSFSPEVMSLSVLLLLILNKYKFPSP